MKSLLPLLIAGLLAAEAAAKDPVVMTLGTIPKAANERINRVKGALDPDRPGWFVELSREAARRCNGAVAFQFMAWDRVLKRVKSGKLAGGFNSSYKPERAVYGVYPKTAGDALDERRSSRFYAYHVYVAKDAADSIDLKGKKVAAERNSAILPLLKERGAEIVEVGSSVAILYKLVKGQVDASVGVGGNLDLELASRPNLGDKIKKLDPPLQKKVGYVMFSKPFYAEHRDLVECFWTQSAELRASDWFRNVRTAYRKP